MKFTGDALPHGMAESWAGVNALRDAAIEPASDWLRTARRRPSPTAEQAVVSLGDGKAE